jgi:hypothetical protein
LTVGVSVSNSQSRTFFSKLANVVCCLWALTVPPPMRLQPPLQRMLLRPPALTRSTYAKASPSWSPPLPHTPLATAGASLTTERQACFCQRIQPCMGCLHIRHTKGPYTSHEFAQPQDQCLHHVWNQCSHDHAHSFPRYDQFLNFAVDSCWCGVQPEF